MFHPVKVVDLDLDAPLGDLDGLHAYGSVLALIRLRGVPIGQVTVPVSDGRCAADALATAIAAQLGAGIAGDRVHAGSTEPCGGEPLGLGDVPGMSRPAIERPLPLVTVAVCTRDRPADLAVCLEALTRLRYPRLDLLVVDNAPTTDEAERLVRCRHGGIRYVQEPRPGLDWARNRAIAESRGEVVAYTDDDAVVDPGWVAALARVFVEDPEVMAVTGLVLPQELETEPQLLFEEYCGFGRGFERRRYRRGLAVTGGEHGHIAAWRFGTGANMAFRRTLLDRIGGFDPALDVGTVTNGGGDLDMFFRVIEDGGTLVYDPAVLVRHRHRREHAALLTQVANNGIGLSAYLVRNALAYPAARAAIARFGLARLARNARRALLAFLPARRRHRDLVLAELRGSLIGLVRYPRSRRIALDVDATFRSTVRPLAEGRETPIHQAPPAPTA